MNEQVDMILEDAVLKSGNEHSDCMISVQANAPTLANDLHLEARLIDDGLMHFEASQAGYLERHSRGETSHTLHVWWARRPHSAMRSLVFAALCKETSERTLRLLASTVSSNSGDHSVLAECERLLLDQYGRQPTLLDMFGGGGTIPLEGVNLGADVYASDINELSVFIQKCNLEFTTSELAAKLKKQIEESGKAILERLRDSTFTLYPLRSIIIKEGTKPGPITYLWSYSRVCGSCGYKHYISKRPWLTKKGGRELYLKPLNGKVSQTFEIADAKITECEPGTRSSSFTCPRCDAASDANIERCQDEIVSLVLKNIGTGKTFDLPRSEACPDPKTISQFEEKILAELNAEVPSSTLPRWSGIVNPALYGIRTHGDFLNKRQRAVLIALIFEISVEHKRLRTERPENEAKFITGILSGLLDQIIDWNCRLSMWIPQNEQVGRAFCGPGVAMLWDYAEADPLLDGPANLWSKLERIVDGVDALTGRRGKATVQRASARKLPYADNFFDAIVTDPPYYDNIYYSILADFFFSWKRLLLKHVDKELFETAATAGAGHDELVASSIRSGGPEQAHLDYRDNLTEALQEAARVLKPDGVMSFVYTHASLGGWAALVHAFRNSGLLITSAQPLSIERKARPRAMGSEAVNTCIAFVARKHPRPKQLSDKNILMNRFKTIVEGGFSDGLLAAGWNLSDTAIALYAQGVGLLAGVAEIDGASDFDTLQAFEAEVRKKFPDFKIKKRASL